MRACFVLQNDSDRLLTVWNAVLMIICQIGKELAFAKEQTGVIPIIQPSKPVFLAFIKSQVTGG
jgi:hypothetical protein